MVASGYTGCMAIQLAPAALERVRSYLAADPSALGLRFGVRRTGCSGWGYLAELARDQREGDTVFESGGVRIYVDADSLALVDGTTSDFLKAGLSGQVAFANPNVAGVCGCGESFTTEAERAAGFRSRLPPRPQEAAGFECRRAERERRCP